MTHRILFFFCLALCLSATVPALAEDEKIPVQIEQKSVNGIFGTVTITDVMDKVVGTTKRDAAQLNLVPGRYFIKAEPPSGMTTELIVSDGDTAIVTERIPQTSVIFTSDMQPKILLRYSLSYIGDVSVASDPSGIPFTLYGPNDTRMEGVTPSTYKSLAVGTYNVQYQPTGCRLPPMKSGTLSKGDRLSFTFNIVCDTLRAPPPKPTQEALKFSDVRAEDWFAPYVESATSYGLIAGYKNADGTPSGTFGPGNSVTLAELAKLALSVSGMTDIDMQAVPSNEHAPDDWSAPYIAAAESLDWMLYTDATTNPQRPATRTEVLVTLLQALDIPLRWPKGDRFADVSRRTTGASAIETAAYHGFISGSAQGGALPAFYPRSTINRAEMAKLLTLMFEYHASR